MWIENKVYFYVSPYRATIKTPPSRHYVSTVVGFRESSYKASEMRILLAKLKNVRLVITV